VRAKPHAPVSAPCTWEEIERGAVGPQSFTLRTMPSRIAEVSDIWDGISKQARTLGAANRRLHKLLS